MKKKKKDVWFLLKFVFSLISPYKRWVAIALFAVFLTVFIDLLNAVLIQNIIGSALAKDRQSLVKLLCVMFGAIVLGVTGRLARVRFSGKLCIASMKDFREKYFNHIRGIEFPFIDRFHSGDLISRFNNDAATIENLVNGDFLDFFYQPAVFAGAIVLMALISWPLLLANIFFFLVSSVGVMIVNKPIARYSNEMQVCMGKINSRIKNAITGMHIIKAFGQKDIQARKYEIEVSEHLKQSLKIEKKFSVLLPFRIILNVFPAIASIVFGAYMSANGIISASSLITFLYLLTIFLQPANRIPAIINNALNATGALERIFEIFGEPLERKNGENYGEGENAIVAEFRDVSFSYKKDTEQLSQTSFCLKKGTTTALVGKSGSGKSTVVKIMTGLYENYSGSVFLFGRELNHWHLSSLRNLISFVVQDSHVFPASVMENISYGKPNSTKQEVQDAAKSACIHDFILQMPDGYRTKIGDGAVSVSGGQKQRVAIARAFLKDAPLLILDEPTSALDGRAERIIQDSLEKMKGKKTVLIIAHRLSTIRNADQILVLDKGRIVDKGTHEELIGKQGIYSELYHRQSDSCGTEKKAAGEERV